MSDDSWIKEDNKHILEMERERTRQVQAKSEARSEAVKAVAVVIGAIVVIAMIVGGLWSVSQKSAQRITEQTVACTESGGTMFTIQDSGPVCLHLESK